MTCGIVFDASVHDARFADTRALESCFIDRPLRFLIACPLLEQYNFTKTVESFRL